MRSIILAASTGAIIILGVSALCMFQFLRPNPTIVSVDTVAPQKEAFDPPSHNIVADEARTDEPPATADQSDLPEIAEPLIEDVLARSGEDPEAVYYMSSVREAIDEGNPTFARELLRQMREKHSTSVLVEEAEALFKK